MKVLFLANSEVAIPSLEYLSKIHNVEVVTGPDKKRDRGKKLRPTPIKEKALSLGLKVYTPPRVSEGEFLEFVKAHPPDIGVVVAFGEILKEEFINIPKYKIVNLHFSLLPKYRGAEPLRRAILNGEKETGVTTMYINPRLDQGDILLQRRTEISDEDDFGTLSERVSKMGAELLVETLDLIEKGDITPIPQKDEGFEYARKFTKEEMNIPWHRDSVYVRNLVRALSPSPGAYTFFRGKRIKIFKVDLKNDIKEKPGYIVKMSKNELIVSCGEGGVSIKSLQPEGKKRISVEEFIRGYKPKVSEQFTMGGD